MPVPTPVSVNVIFSPNGSLGLLNRTLTVSNNVDDKFRSWSVTRTYALSLNPYVNDVTPKRFTNRTWPTAL